MAVCRLTLFSFCRGGEPARLRLVEWKDGVDKAWIDPAQIREIDPVENSMFEKLDIMYQSGKGNHLVSVFLPQDTTEALAILANIAIRESTGV